VKGRDWYDLVWYIGHHPRLRLTHLEARMRASGGWQEDGRLDRPSLLARLRSTIEQLDVPAAREEAARFVPDASALTLWSREFFLEIIERIETEKPAGRSRVFRRPGAEGVDDVESPVS